VLDDWCAKVGRDPADIERSVGVRAGPSRIAGDLVAAGATHFTLPVSGPDYDLSTVEEWVRWRDTYNADLG
jgi:hypothetical protein